MKMRRLLSLGLLALVGCCVFFALRAGTYPRKYPRHVYIASNDNFRIRVQMFPEEGAGCRFRIAQYVPALEARNGQMCADANTRAAELAARFGKIAIAGSDSHTLAGVGLAWGSDIVVAQLALPSLWNTLCGIGCFALAYAVAAWAHLLSESEKNGIRGALRSTARTLFSKGI